MGEMAILRFRISDRRRLAPAAIDRIVVSGIESSARKTRAFWDDDQLFVEFAGGPSGAVHVPWEISDRGELTLSTASLLARDRPYRLDVELARGLIGQIRSQLAAWQPAGLHVCEATIGRLSRAVAQLSQIATSDARDEAGDAAGQALIELAVEIADQLGALYAQQAIALRQRETQPLPTLLGADLGEAGPAPDIIGSLAGTFHLAKLTPNWSGIESGGGVADEAGVELAIAACQEHALRICVGPLVGSPTRDLPAGRPSDPDGLTARALRRVETIVTRFRGQVQLWHVASGINLPGGFRITPRQRLELIIRAVERTGRLDPNTPRIVSFDQIWGEAADRQDAWIEPLQLADALVRANLGLGGFGLELNVGYHPGGSSPRDPIAFSRQLDVWSLLGLPLLVSLVVPSGRRQGGGREDAEAATGNGVEAPGGADRAEALPEACWGADPQLPSPASQQAWIDRYVPILLAKNSVQLIVWNQLDDRQRNRFPCGGLIDDAGQLKPAAGALRAIRRQYLG